MASNAFEIPTDDGRAFRGYFNGPTAAGGPCLVVVHEIYGITAEVRQVVDQYGRAGFRALAPDLLWRHTPGLSFDYKDRDGAREVMQSLDAARVAGDIESAISALRGASDPSPRTGLLAYGWGGLHAVKAAARRPVEAIAIYYPGSCETVVQIAATLDAGLLFHFAAHDERTPPQVRRSARLAFVDRDDAQVMVYPNAGHGFANPGRSEYHAASATLADRRTMDFFVASCDLHRAEER